jgi:hypothetical protein
VDDGRFDTWVRSWGAPSRRGLLRLAPASGLAGLLSRWEVEDAAAKCVKPGKKCKKNGKKKKCCGGAKCKGKECKCQDSTFACGKNCCIPGQLCVNGASCSNGPIPVGDACNAEEPGACTSGVCGCGFGCNCREADCVGLGEGCATSADCCQGGCSGGQCIPPP